MKDIIIQLLKSTERKGMEDLIAALHIGAFFTAPASTKYHGCYEGGLAEHSYNVYDLLASANDELKLKCSPESIIIAALLHDVCKIGAYTGIKKPYGWNRNQPKGHAILSLERIKKFIELTELEEKMIRYHMGVYGLTEFDLKKGEYPLRNEGLANVWFHHPVVKVMYFCDELATLQEKTREEDR